MTHPGNFYVAVPDFATRGEIEAERQHDGNILLTHLAQKGVADALPSRVRSLNYPATPMQPAPSTGQPMQTETNPYAAPRAPLPEPAPSGRITAVLIGASIGNGIAYAVLALLGMGYFWLLAMQGVPTEQLYAHAFASTYYLVFAHAVGSVCLVPGGYWSARLSPNAGTAAALWAAAIVAALAALDHLAPFELPIPAWSRVASLLAPFPAFWLGAVLRAREVKARARTDVGEVR
jgi:hypothetical protein